MALEGGGGNGQGDTQLAPDGYSACLCATIPHSIQPTRCKDVGIVGINAGPSPHILGWVLSFSNLVDRYGAEAIMSLKPDVATVMGVLSWHHSGNRRRWCWRCIWYVGGRQVTSCQADKGN